MVRGTKVLTLLFAALTCVTMASCSNDDEEDDEEYEEIDWTDMEIDWEEGEEPYKIIITRSGTYMVYYKDSSVAVARWRWLSEAEGQFQYDWGYGWTSDDEGEAWFKLSGGKLIVTEKDVETDEEDGETEETGLEYTLTEVK